MQTTSGDADATPKRFELDAETVQLLEQNTAQRGWWQEDGAPPRRGRNAFKDALYALTRPMSIVEMDGRTAVSNGGAAIMGNGAVAGGHPLLAHVPPLKPEDLGDPVFKQSYSLRYAYVAGAMANGITSVEMVEEMGRAGMIGFFGAGGLPPEKIEEAILGLKERMGDRHPFGFNLIHSPADPELEWATVDLYLKHGVDRISASAYLNLTLPLVYYRVKGIHQDPRGHVICPNKIIAKVSRVEVARRFLAPPPEKLLVELVRTGKISRGEADLARYIPVAEDLTAEADSGGHTDNQPALSLLPSMIALRNRLQEEHRFHRFPRIGLAGGIATPESTAAAFAMGAAYVLTGSINQSCIEAGTSDKVRCMLTEACQADITMAPAADMFEMGVKVQVLKRGTMFPLRAARLYDLYRSHDRYEAIPPDQRATLERDFFQRSFEAEWAATRAFFSRREPAQIERAERDPKHKMALVFRSYLGRSSVWAVSGDPERVIDYQIWCGPSLGAFNEWVRGSFLEPPENRRTVTVALNLLFGASVATRAAGLRNQGVVLPPAVDQYRPLTLDDMARYLNRAPQAAGRDA